MANQDFRVKNGLQVGVGGTILKTIANGNIGINSTQPTSKLDVNGDVDVAGTLDVDGHTELDNVNVSGAITATTFTGNLAGTVNTAAQPNITSVGTLGALTVSGVSTFGNNIRIEGTSEEETTLTFKHTDVVNNVSAINFEAHAGGGIATSRVLFDWFGSEYGQSHGLNYVSGRGDHWQNHWFRKADGEIQLSIRNDGNVAIGSHTPTSKLDVSGDVKVTGVVTATAFYGSGANLSDIITGVGIGSDGTTVGTAITSINFVGSGVTATAHTSSGISTIRINATQGAQGATGSVTNTPAHDVTSFTATQGQTTFSVSYTAGQIDVYLNGVRLSAADITASNGTSVVIGTAAEEGDILDVVETTLGVGPQGTTGTQGLQGVQGVQGSSFNRSSFTYTATANQTSFSGSDDNGETLAYTRYNLDVFLNGAHLDPSDYTATNGTAVVLASGATVGDTVTITAFTSAGPQGIQGLTGSFSGSPARTVSSATATGGQTNFSVSYDVGFLDVYQNGLRLNSTEFTATNGTSVVLASGATGGDILDFVEMDLGVGAQGAAGAQGAIGTSYSRGTSTFTATANQTTFTISYTVGYIEVYLNGVRLSAADFTATNGTSVVLANGAAVNDIVDCVTFTTAGETGAQGTQGIQGTTGSGSQGTTGTQGTLGTQGTTGAQGTTGTSGEGLSAGSANQIIFRNNSNTVAGSANLTFNGTNLTVSGITSTGNLNVVGVTTATSFFGDGSGLSGVGGESDITSSLFS